MKKYTLLLIIILISFGLPESNKLERVSTVITTESGLKYEIIKIGDGEKNGFLHVDDLGPLRRKKISAGITELLDFEQPIDFDRRALWQ